jgi:hypothetical protein
MLRLPQPARSDFEDPADRDAYDAVIDRRSKMAMVNDGDDPDKPAMGEYWGSLINSPQMCAIAARMGNFIRTAGERDNTYAHWERELVDQVLSADWKTNVVQELHVPDGIAAGVRIDAVEALRFGDEDRLNEDERLLVRYIRQVVSGTVDDETFGVMQEHLGTRGLVEYTGFILWLQWIIRMMQALGVTSPPDDEIDALIRGLRDGSIALPNFHERIG